MVSLNRQLIALSLSAIFQKLIFKVYLHAGMFKTKITVRPLLQQEVVAWQHWMQSGIWQQYMSQLSKLLLRLNFSLLVRNWIDYFYLNFILIDFRLKLFLPLQPFENQRVPSGILSNLFLILT